MIERRRLNKRLLDELESMPNAKLFFNHKLVGADFRRNIAWFEQSSATESGATTDPARIEAQFDLLIGADGAYSAARYHLMKYTRIDYKQEHIDTMWCEFKIPPRETDHGNDSDSRFRLPPDHLHIWYGKEAMFISIPNLV